MAHLRSEPHDSFEAPASRVCRFVWAAGLLSAFAGVGCGTGYASPAMARMASAVVALESDPELVAHANRILTELGMDTVTVVEAPLQAGYPRQAPYDVVFFSGGVAEIPTAITNQLADGGRMVAVVYDKHGIGKGTLFLRVGDVVSRRAVFDASAPMLSWFERESTFEF